MLGLALGCDLLSLQQERADRPPSIKLSMVADLSCLQSAQDDLVKPSTSSTLYIEKFPPHSTIQRQLVQHSGCKIFADPTSGAPGYFKHSKAWLQEWTSSHSATKRPC